MFFVYNGTVDQVRPRLFASAREADNAWDAPQEDVPSCDADPAAADEDVEVMPYFSHGDRSVLFVSRANRAREVISGARSLGQATEQRSRW